MSHLGNFIADVIEAERRAGKTTTQKSLSERMRIKSSMLSRFMNQPHPSCNRETLANMTRGISDDPQVQARLQAAYLMDQRVGESGQLVEVHTIGRTREPDGHYGDRLRPLVREANRARLNPKQIDALSKIIAATAASPRFRRSVLDLAEIAEHDILK